MNWRKPDGRQQPPAIGAVIFDMDGTLTRPYLDFDLIRAEIGLPNEPRTPVLEALTNMTAVQRARAENILDQYETEAALASELQDGACEVLSTLRRASIPLGLLTRNSRRCVEIVLDRHGLRFDCIYAREDGPIKPSPVPIQVICRQFGASPTASWMVGDYLFDVQAGRQAGATTVLMVGDAPMPAYADQAHHVVRRLHELLTLLAIHSSWSS